MASFDTAPSSRPLPSKIKTTILNFIKGLVNKKVYRAAEIILSPCCDPHLTAVAVCDPDHPGNYIVTVTSSTPINLGSSGLATVNSGSGGAHIYPMEEGATTFVFTNLEATPGDPDISVSFLLVINQSFYDGRQSLITVGYGFPGIPIVFPPCI